MKTERISKDKIVKMEFKNIELEIEVRRFGNASHIILPKVFAGKRILVKIKEVKNEDN